MDATDLKVRRDGRIASVAAIVNGSWQRCRMHFMRNVLAHAGRQGRRDVSAFIATAFAQNDAESASAQWRQVADQLRPRVRRLAELMDDAESDVLACMRFPAAHRAKLHSTNPIERPNGEIKRRTEVVGIVPNDQAIVNLVGTLLKEQNDERAVPRARHMTLEAVAHLSHGPTHKLPGVAASASGQTTPQKRSAPPLLNHAHGHHRAISRSAGG